MKYRSFYWNRDCHDEIYFEHVQIDVDNWKKYYAPIILTKEGILECLAKDVWIDANCQGVCFSETDEGKMFLIVDRFPFKATTYEMNKSEFISFYRTMTESHRMEWQKEGF